MLIIAPSHISSYSKPIGCKKSFSLGRNPEGRMTWMKSVAIFHRPSATVWHVLIVAILLIHGNCASENNVIGQTSWSPTPLAEDLSAITHSVDKTHVGSNLIHPVRSDKCGTLKSPGVTIPSGDIVLREGSPLNIYCQLSEEYMNKPGHMDSRSLVFYRNKYLLPREMIKIVNDSTILLHIDNMTASSNLYYCKFNDSQAVCLNNVAVDNTPTGVLNFSCVSQNWLNLTCTWKAKPTYVTTTYKLAYRLPGRAGFGVEYPCPMNQPEYSFEGAYRCFWNLSTSPHYRQLYPNFSFTMNSTNVFGSHIEKFDVLHYAHVILNKPHNLTVTNKTAHSALLSWELQGPIINIPSNIIHRVKYQSQYDEQDAWHVEPVFEKKQHIIYYNLQNLPYSHTFYDVRVQMRTGDARGDQWWSEFSALTVRTKSERPARAPRTDIGSFEISGAVNHRDVYIYWQQIPEWEQNGDMFTYNVNVKENGAYKNIKPNESTPSYAKYIGLQFNEYEFEVYSANEVGPSPDISRVRIPKFDRSVPEPLSFTKIAYGRRTYELSWKSPVIDIFDPIVSYTVFWCKNERDRPYQCVGYLNWTKVSSNLSIWNQTVADNSIYQFAISANTATASSGMVWASCTVIHNKFVGKMKSVWINRIGPTFIEVGWKLDCSDRIGWVTGFRIYFCPIRDPINPSCIEKESSTIVYGDLNTMHGLVQNLRPYTTYMLAVAVITKYEETLRSDVMYNTTLESSPAAPQNVSIANVTNSSITLLWDAPLSMNGILRYYHVKFNQTEFKVEQHMRNITIRGLLSYTLYYFEIAACTISCSEPVCISEKTRRGTPGKMSSPNIKFMNESQMTMTWSPPQISGGPIEYELCLNRSQNDEVTSKIFPTRANQITLHTPECEKEPGTRITFTLSIRAVTFDETGHRLEGPWSEVINNSCKRPAVSNLLMYCVLFMSIIVMLAMFGWMTNKVCTRCKSMRDVEVKLPPGLTPTSATTELALSQWSSPDSIIHTPLKLTKERIVDDVKILHTIAADEQLLLEKKREFDGEMDSNTATPPDSNACSSANESISSISSTNATNSKSNEHEADDSSDKSSCSLRLRNITLKNDTLLMSDANQSQQSQNIVLPSKGYVPMPPLDTTEFCFKTGGWNSKQAKGNEAYSQIAVEAAIPNTTYVPHPMLSRSGNKIPTISSTTPSSSNSSSGSSCLTAQLVSDEYDNEECPDNSEFSLLNLSCSLGSLSTSTSSSHTNDDLININENSEHQVKVTAPSSYVSLSSALCNKAAAAPPKPAPTVTNVHSTPSNPYSRVGTWNGTDLIPDVTSASVPSHTEHLVPSPKILTKSTNYIPHRQFECKLLKED